MLPYTGLPDMCVSITQAYVPEQGCGLQKNSRSPKAPNHEILGAKPLHGKKCNSSHPKTKVSHLWHLVASKAQHCWVIFRLTEAHFGLSGLQNFSLQSDWIQWAENPFLLVQKEPPLTSDQLLCMPQGLPLQKTYHLAVPENMQCIHPMGSHYET